MSFEKRIILLAVNRKSDFFHDLVRDLAEKIGFSKTEEWGEADSPYSRTVQFLDMTQLGENPEIRFSNFARRKKFERGSEFIISTTNHRTPYEFLRGLYIARSVMTNSLMGLKNQAIEYGMIKEMFPSTGKKDTLALAFDDNKIVRLGILYFIHPKHLYELAFKNTETR